MVFVNLDSRPATAGRPIRGPTKFPGPRNGRSAMGWWFNRGAILPRLMNRLEDRVGAPLPKIGSILVPSTAPPPKIGSIWAPSTVPPRKIESILVGAAQPEITIKNPGPMVFVNPDSRSATAGRPGSRANEIPRPANRALRYGLVG